MHRVLMSAGNSVLVETNKHQKSYQLQIQTKMKPFTTSSFTAVSQLTLPEVWLNLSSIPNGAVCF